MRDLLIHFLERIKDYEHESGRNMYEDERESFEIVDIYLEEFQGEAHVQLILAAPKMLEALENLENDNGAIPDHAWKRIKDAIECAVGK